MGLRQSRCAAKRSKCQSPRTFFSVREVLMYLAKAEEFRLMSGEVYSATAHLIALLGPGYVQATMCLTEIQNLLDRWWETMATYHHQLESYADMHSGRLGQEIKNQLGRDNLQPQLVDVFLCQVKERLQTIQKTSNRCDDLGSLVDTKLKDTKSRLTSLEDEQKTAERISGLCKAVKFVFKFVVVAGSAFLVFQCLPAVPGLLATWKLRGLKAVLFKVASSQSVVSQGSRTFLTSLGMGAIESISDNILQGVKSLETKLAMLTQCFMSVFEQMQSVKTAIHRILEWRVTAKNALASVRKSRAKSYKNKYEFDGFQDEVESFLECLGNLKRKLAEQKTDDSFASPACQARIVSAVKARVVETTTCVRVAYDVTSAIGRLLGRIVTWVAQTTGVLDKLLPDAYDDKPSERNLQKLRDVLKKCQQLLEKCAQQILSCSALATERDGQKAKAQIARGTLDLQLVVMFLRNFEHRLSDVKCSVEKFQQLGCKEAKCMAKEQAERLELKMSQYNGKCQVVEGVQTVTRFVGGYWLTCLAAVSLTTGTFPVAMAVAGALGWGAIEASTAAIIENISCVLHKMRELEQCFVDVHGDLDAAETSMHRLSECVHRMDDDLTCVKATLTNCQKYGKYHMDALSDEMKQLLEGLVAIGQTRY